MKNVFLRRLLLLLIITMLLIAAAVWAGTGFVGKSTYRSIKLEEMLPKAEAVRQLMYEYAAGELSRQAFVRLADKLAAAAGATIFIVDTEKNISYMNQLENQLSVEMLQQELSSQIETVLANKQVTDEDAFLKSVGRTLVAGVPVTDAKGTAAGGVFVIKPAREIDPGFNRLNTPLFITILIVTPLLFIVITWRMHIMTEPLHEMAGIAIEMAKGNFNVRVSESETGEVGLLASALNNLCEALSQSITQLKNEKNQLNKILYSLTDGVAAQDCLGILTHYNPALMEMFGSVEAETREQLIPDKNIWKAFDEVNETGEPQTITYTIANGKTLMISVSPVVGQDGAMTGTVGLFKDVSEMERLENMRREYVANISHELRTPLTAVRGLLEPLSDGLVEDEADKQRYYKIMLHEVLRLSRMISDMLVLSSIQVGTEYIELKKVDMRETVADVVSRYRNSAEEKGIALKLKLEDKTPYALTDGDKVEQILIILIDNAMRYTEKGGEIEIGIRNSDRLMVSVTDTGCGIPEEDIPYVFERFYKVDKSRKEGGTGLGLAIASGLLKNMGESITVYSKEGEGTSFTFTLKKYVSNAISLGPVKEKPAVVQEKEVFAGGLDKQEKTTVKDAAYEIIDNSAKKAGKKDKKS